MKLKVRHQRLSAGEKAIAVLNEEDAKELGVLPLDRIMLSARKRKVTVIVNTTNKYIKEGEVGLFTDVYEILKTKEVEVQPVKEFSSVRYIREKIEGRRLTKGKIKTIVKDVVDRNLSDVEIAAFVTALKINGISLTEATYITESMVETGSQLKLPRRRIFDKHSIGGISGDKTTPILVPIVAAAGLTIPKTSSRAITSPAGTADRVEVLCPVALSLEEMKRVVMKTNGCLVWGGAVDLTPADDLFIRVEYPLALDPLMLPSIMSKKEAVGATDVVIDIPIGPGSKILTKKSATLLSRKFRTLGARLGIHIDVAYTEGFEPLGHGIGPCLAAREILHLITGKYYNPQIEKAVKLANILLRRAGKSDQALHILQSGKAEKKLREIIAEQGGNPDIKPEDIPVGGKVYNYKSTISGRIIQVIDNDVAEIARKAGSPKDKEAGVFLWKKTGDFVKKGETIVTIYAKKNYKLNRAMESLKKLKPFVVREKARVVRV